MTLPPSHSTTFAYFTSAPAAPSTFAVSFTNATNARFSWAAVSNASSYRLWGTNYTAKKSLDSPGLATTTLSTNLALGDWWFSVYPTNNAGQGNGASALRFWTR